MDTDTTGIVHDNDDFVARLLLQPPLSDMERERIRSLGAGSPLDLAALHRAVPPEVESVLGARSREILDHIRALLTDEERKKLEVAIPSPRKFGALLGPSTEIRPSKEKMTRRNKLADEAQALAALPPTPDSKRRLMEIDEELRSIDEIA